MIQLGGGLKLPSKKSPYYNRRKLIKSASFSIEPIVVSKHNIEPKLEIST